jgi:uncharacterized protein (DUF58 family)
MPRVDQTLAGLTIRGRCLLAAGFAAVICAAALHEVNLLRIGIFLLALPMIAYAMVSRTRYRLTCTRRLDPVRVNAGSPAQVLLRLQNVSRLPTGLMLAEDTVPYMLGGRPRFVLDRVLPQRAVDVDYSVRSQLRGRFRIGPLTVRLTDPFGLCELTRAFSASDLLVVTPQVVSLPEVRLGGDWAGAGESRARSVATAGEDDAATREYRRGDDLRRIHWRSTARVGELMVRREEQPWQSRAALLLDCRGDAHHGDGPLSSLEWAISAAASIGLHLAKAGFTMRVVGDAGDEVATASVGNDAFDGLLLDDLAVRTASPGTSVRPGITSIRRGGGEEMLVAIIGPLNSDDAQTLARAAHGGPSVGVAVVLDTASWTALAPRAAEAAHLAHRQTCEVLAAAGWRVLPARAGASIAELWPAAGSGASAAAGRDSALVAAGVAAPAGHADSGGARW